jgi:hypothetical protein
MRFMQNRTRLVATIGSALFLVSAMSGSARAQWIKYPDPATPRTSDGKPNLTAPAPMKNGKPDFSGIWKIVRPRTIPAESILVRIFDCQMGRRQSGCRFQGIQ